MARTTAAKKTATDPVTPVIDDAIFYVGLDQLELSELNVRKTDAELDIEGLADDIATNGLKQNLRVVENWEPGAPFKSYGVVAGSRRLRALKLLVDNGVLLENHPVPVGLETVASAPATSLSENLSRVAMNAADECEAFETVLGDDRSPAALAVCARRFGVTVRRVEERLRLAALSPEILDRLRRGTLLLKSAEAYATFSDHALQDKVFKAQEKSQSFQKHEPRAVRDAMRGKTYPVSSPWVRYAGTEAYLAAGGRIEASMFMGAGDEDALIDTRIFEKVALAKAETEARHLAQADGWRDGVMMVGFSSWPQFPKVPDGYRSQWVDADTLTSEEKADRIALYKLRAGFGEDNAVGLNIERTIFAPVPAPASGESGHVEGEGHSRPQRSAETEAALLARRQRAAALSAWMGETPPEQFVVDDGTAEWGELDDWFDFEEDGSAIIPMMVTIPAAVIEAKLAALRAAGEAAVEADDHGSS
jgi:ParB family transcriptional regulator, chromosome partitioning protein